MKKFFLVLGLCLVTVTPAFAHHPVVHSRPPVHHEVIVHRNVPKHRVGSGIYFLSGLAGAAVGSLIVNSQYQGQTESNDRCFIVVSKSTGNVTKKCVSGAGADEVLYVD